MKTLAALALALLLLPSHAPPALAEEPLNACVKRSGALYLVGPEYRRQECRPNDTPTTINAEGVEGPQGPTGPPGMSGAPGQNIRLLDANGDEVGLVLSRPSGPNVNIWHTTLHLFTAYDTVTGLLTTLSVGDNFYFTEPNCQGTAYAAYLIPPSILHKLVQFSAFGLPDGYYVLDTFTHNVQPVSRRDTGGCFADGTPLADASTFQFVAPPGTFDRPAPLSISGP